MTRYKRRSAQRAPARNETMRDLIAEVRALRAEIAVLSAERVQVVPMPYPQPYPVYPTYPQPSTIYPWNPGYTPYRITVSGDTTTTISDQLAVNRLTSGSGGPTSLTYNVGD